MTYIELIDQLINSNGHIVPTGQLTVGEIELARKDNRFALYGDFGLVRMPESCTFLPPPVQQPKPAEQPTCGKCGKPMKFNVPRLGPDGGYVHAETGYLDCGNTPPQITMSYETSELTALRQSLSEKDEEISKVKLERDKFEKESLEAIKKDKRMVKSDIPEMPEALSHLEVYQPGGSLWYFARDINTIISALRTSLAAKDAEIAALRLCVSDVSDRDNALLALEAIRKENTALQSELDESKAELLKSQHRGNEGAKQFYALEDEYNKLKSELAQEREKLLQIKQLCTQHAMGEIAGIDLRLATMDVLSILQPDKEQL